MARFTEETLTNWTKPASDNEENKLSNAAKLVREAIGSNSKLSKHSIDIFGQGSYANDTNVRLNSDIDINVMYNDGFYFTLPTGKVRGDFGFDELIDYSFDEFKNDVEVALVAKFGRSDVKRNEKCITIVANSTRVETDVVPTWQFRRYAENKSFVEGVKFRADSGSWVESYPKAHIDNGKTKNANTYKRFKRLTRIFKKIRYKMLEENVVVNQNITSFLLECLVWNVPNEILINNGTWSERLRATIIFLYNNTLNDSDCSEWGEVSERLYLIRSSRKWSRQDINDHLVAMWQFLQF